MKKIQYLLMLAEETVNEKDLLNALEKNFGAGLDVVEKEPIKAIRLF